MKSCYLSTWKLSNRVWSREEWNSYRQLISKEWENKEELTQKIHLAVLVAYAPEACSE